MDIAVVMVSDRMALSLIPWKSGKMLLWDVTVASTLADSYVASAAHGAGELAEEAGAKKHNKYADLSATYEFIPLRKAWDQ